MMLRKEAGVTLAAAIGVIAAELNAMGGEIVEIAKMAGRVAIVEKGAVVEDEVN
jgi:predicted outer membrane lipoprotein